MQEASLTIVLPTSSEEAWLSPALDLSRIPLLHRSVRRAARETTDQPAG